MSNLLPKNKWVGVCIRKQTWKADSPTNPRFSTIQHTSRNRCGARMCKIWNQKKDCLKRLPNNLISMFTESFRKTNKGCVALP